MKKNKAIWILIFMLISVLSCNHKNEEKADNESIKQHPEPVEKEEVKFRYEMQDAAYPDAMLELYSPLENQTFKEGGVSFEFNIKNYPFGDMKKAGPLKVIINGDDPISYNMHVFKKDFKTGTYKIVAYLVDKNGLALKEYGNYVDRDFVVGNSRPFPENEDPVIGLNLPHNDQEFEKGEAVAIDFLLVGGDLKEDGLRVKVSVDSQEYVIEEMGNLTVNNLPEGDHMVTVALIDRDGNELPGVFSKSIKKIKVKS